MKTATVADLRNNFRLVSSRISSTGEPDKSSNEDELSPLQLELELGWCLVHFLIPISSAQLQEIWGNRVFITEGVKIHERRRATPKSQKS
jgi:hypothetical protein